MFANIKEGLTSNYAIEESLNISSDRGINNQLVEKEEPSLILKK